MPERRFRALVVDDEPAAREAVVALLADFAPIEVAGQAGSGDEAVAATRRLRPDLLFLDVQMPGRDGFGVLEELGADVPRAVVFVTAFDEHALRAFEVHALDYVVKPFGRPRFAAAVERALARLEADEALSLRRTLAAAALSCGSPAPEGELAAPSADRGPAARLALRLGPRTLLLPVEELDWVEADGDYVRLHAGDGAHFVAGRLSALEERLDPSHFLRIHRSLIVRLDRVRELRREADGGGCVVLHDGVRLRVARGRWEALEQALRL
jgi:two-component system LytT family response regulator